VKAALALAALVSCHPAVAQEANTSADAGLFVTVLPEVRLSDGAIGEIVHHNRETRGPLGEAFYEFETTRGLVILRLVTTTNSYCSPGCPDLVEVWEAPPGVVAVPRHSHTPENGVAILTLFEFIGM